MDNLWELFCELCWYLFDLWISASLAFGDAILGYWDLQLMGVDLNSFVIGFIVGFHVLVEPASPSWIAIGTAIAALLGFFTGTQSNVLFDTSLLVFPALALFREPRTFVRMARLSALLLAAQWCAFNFSKA